MVRSTTSLSTLNTSGAVQHGRPQALKEIEQKWVRATILGVEGKVVTVVVGEESQNAVLPNVREKVLPSALIYSDEHAAYNPLRSLGYQHRRVHHAAKVYVQGDAHTNTIEGFWSLVKRGISGVNHAVSKRYLQSYLNEYAFRYNRRDQEQPMFEAFFGQVVKQGE